MHLAQKQSTALHTAKLASALSTSSLPNLHAACTAEGLLAPLEQASADLA